MAFRPTGITYLGLDRGEPFDAVKSQIERRLRRRVRPSEPPDWLDMSGLTEFERAAMRKAMEIPRGEVRSYSWIAREIGHSQAARAVGQAMARNPLALLVPCHRVVDASGALHNYGYGLEVKARILQMEGYAPQPRRSRA
ncbi:MAG: MGMT family protein [Candidatus Eremiobacteraeota bacterium]|nr:MGMT family protein [Candidatus Eremiobacteraeota bacterium]